MQFWRHRKYQAWIFTVMIHALLLLMILNFWSIPPKEESLRDISSMALLIAATTQPQPEPVIEAVPTAPPPPMQSEIIPSQPVTQTVASEVPVTPKPAHKPKPIKKVESSKPVSESMSTVSAPQATIAPAPEVSATPASSQSGKQEEALPMPSVSANVKADISAAYRAMVHARIMAVQTYPITAKRLGEEGTVLVRFVILSNGKIESVTVIETSGSDSLDSAAVTLFTQGLGGQLPPIPVELQKSSWVFSVPIRYQLTAG